MNAPNWTRYLKVMSWAMGRYNVAALDSETLMLMVGRGRDKYLCIEKLAWKKYMAVN